MHDSSFAAAHELHAMGCSVSRWLAPLCALRDSRPVPLPPTTTVAPRPLPAPQPKIATPQPPVVRDESTPQPAAEISDAEATQILSRHLAATNTYDVASSCLGIRNLGYKNVGYTLEVV